MNIGGLPIYTVIVGSILNWQREKKSVQYNTKIPQKLWCCTDYIYSNREIEKSYAHMCMYLFGLLYMYCILCIHFVYVQFLGWSWISCEISQILFFVKNVRFETDQAIGCLHVSDKDLVPVKHYWSKWMNKFVIPTYQGLQIITEKYLSPSNWHDCFCTVQ